MNNNNIQDVVPPTHKRSIRDIPIPARNKKNNDIKKYQDIDNREQEPPIKNNSNDEFLDDFNEPPKGNSLKLFVIGLGVIVFAFIIFIIFSIFDRAIVDVNPKMETASFDQQVLIENLTNRNTSDSLGYRVIELSQEVTKNVQAIDEEPVKEKASGEITIFNEFSKDSQRLIKNTRFESTDGKIYRIQDSVDVPGFIQGADGEMVPGEITVTVYADEIGEEYNLQSDKFTIPGFKDQEPYDFFSAKTKTPITGGFDGIRKIISQSDTEKANTELQQELKNKLISDLNEQITEEFYTYYDDNSFVFNNLEQTDKNNEVELKLRGKIEAKVFNKTDLSNKLAEILFNSYNVTENTSLTNFDSINIKYLTDEQKNEYLQISGQSEFIWQIDENQLKNDLIGQKETDFINIMKNYTEVEKAELKIKPFWRATFPEKEKDIKIKINLEE